MTADPVNHPAHYTSGPSCECGRVIETITITRPHTFARGNALKYLLRAGLKDPDRTAEDLQKAIWYITDEYRARVRSRVLAGLCDADIAAELGRTPGEIARVRRAAELPANPRYRRNT